MGLAEKQENAQKDQEELRRKPSWDRGEREAQKTARQLKQRRKRRGDHQMRGANRRPTRMALYREAILV